MLRAVLGAGGILVPQLGVCWIRGWGEPAAVLLQCRGIVRDAAESPGLDSGGNKQS